MKKLLFLIIPVSLTIASYALLDRVSNTVGQAFQGAEQTAEGGFETAAGVATLRGDEVEQGLYNIGEGAVTTATSPVNLAAPYRDGYYDYDGYYGPDYDDYGPAGYYGGYYGDGDGYYGRGRGGHRFNGSRGGFRGAGASRKPWWRTRRTSIKFTEGDQQ